MTGDGVGLHMMLWLHQYASYWLPLLTVLLLLGLGWATVYLLRILLRCGTRRGLMLLWRKGLGGPAMMTCVGLLLLVSPGWSWPDALLDRADSIFFQEIPASPGSLNLQPDAHNVNSALLAWGDMTAEGLELAEMMEHSGKLTLLWLGLELALVALIFAVLVPGTFRRRRRWLFHRPSAAWRLFHCDLSPASVTALVWVGLVPGLVISEWLRNVSPFWPGAVLQAGLLICGTALLICVVRRSGIRWGGRAIMVLPASLMLLRLIWILT